MNKIIVPILAICLLSLSSLTVYATVTGLETNDSEEKIEQNIENERVSEKKQQMNEFDEAEEEKNAYVSALAEYIVHTNRNVAMENAMEYATYFVNAGEKYDLDEKILMAMARKESTYYVNSLGGGLYYGLMQISEHVGNSAGYQLGELYDPEKNIDAGARYLSLKIKQYEDLALALTSYNYGHVAISTGEYSLGYYNSVTNYVADIEEFVSERLK